MSGETASPSPGAEPAAQSIGASLHRRLVLAATLGTGLAVGLAALGIWLLAGITAWRHWDQEIGNRLEQLQGLARLRDGEVKFPPGTFDGAREESVVVVDGANRLRFAYGLETDLRRPAARQVHWLAQPFHPPGRGGGRAADTTDSAPEAAEPLTLTVTRSTARLAEERTRLALVLGFTWILATGLAALLAWRLIHRALDPVHRLAAVIAGIDPAATMPDLALAGPPSPTELRVVQERLAGLLQRVDQALRQERQTASLLAHELRTPIAGLRATVEFALARPRDPGADAEDLRCCQELTLILGDTVEGLLLVHRLERGLVELDPQPVDVADLVADAQRSVTAQGRDGGPACLLAPADPPRPRLLLDRALTGLLLRNLLTNARQHGDPEVPIVIQATWDRGRLLLGVMNGVRASAPDSPREVHAQLGLPLCRRIVERLGGTLDIQRTAATHQVVCRWPCPAVSDP